VTPAEAAVKIRATANEFARGAASVHDMWDGFHSHLIPLCADEALNGEFLQMFNDLEAWEASVGEDRVRAVETVRATAQRLSASA
jgi:hypothetical protein